MCVSVLWLFVCCVEVLFSLFVVCCVWVVVLCVLCLFACVVAVVVQQK